MNVRRVAQLLRELADEIEADMPANDVPPKPRKPARASYVPTVVPSDVDRARAREVLRKRGIFVRKA